MAPAYPTATPSSRPSSAQDDRAKQRLRVDYNDTIGVLAGEEEESLVVHKNMICAKSPYFEAACKESWRGADDADGAIRLRYIELIIFKIYVHWVYSSRVDLAVIDPHCMCTHNGAPLELPHAQDSNELERCGGFFYTNLLVRLWLAADVLLDSMAKCKTMVALVQFAAQYTISFNADIFNYV